MTYNILNGAVETLPQIIEVVKKESPDFLMLNEANTFAKNNNALLKEFAVKTGFPYFKISLSGEGDWHIAVFSKYPLKNIYMLKPLARACIIATIESIYGPISIASLHLTPYTEDLRQPEIESIIAYQKPFSHKILMGDMNSLSRNDGYKDNIIKDFDEIRIRKFTTNGKLRFDIIDKILKAGYHDTAQLLEKNIDTTVPTLSKVGTKHSPMRLDYIFLSKSLLPFLQSYKVIKNKITNLASDHYPVVVEL
ncbi:endonuclease/exonuclease/phosphatase family protein [Patescibacteria group bacterium]